MPSKSLPATAPFPGVKSSRRFSARFALASSALAASAIAGLTGCSNMSTSASSPASISAATIKGTMHGGQQPVSGAHIYFYAAGSSGYGAPSQSLLTAGSPGVTTDSFGNGYVTTDGGGVFTITGDYTCPTSGSGETYLYAVGGNPGLATGTNNTAITMLAAVGPCSGLSASTTVNINEVTTAAFATALRPFIGNQSSVGTSAGNTAGFTNAFNSIANIIDIPSGVARGTNALGNGTVPTPLLNTLGNILSPCVNSASSTSSPCTSLFAAVTPSGATAPTDVATAMIDIAQRPTYNTTALFGMMNAQSPFQPVLTSAPASYTVGITYTAPGMNAPGVIAIDGAGSAWIVNCPNCTTNTHAGATGTDAIVGIASQGTVLSGSGYTSNIHLPQSIALDTDGNIWSSDLATGSTPDEVVLTTPQGTTQFTVSGAMNPAIATPNAIAIDAGNNPWVANAGSSTGLKLSHSGSVLASATSNGFAYPLGIGIDNNGTIYMAGNQSSTILSFDTNGSILSPAAGYTGAGINGPIGIAVDGSQDVWTFDNGSTTDAVSEIVGTTGAAVSPASGYNNRGLQQAAIISIDGAGTAWLANCGHYCNQSTNPDSIVHLDASGNVITTDSGLQDPAFAGVGTTAIDASGNLWVSNNYTSTVTEVLGVATPIDTPMAQQVAIGSVGKPAGTVTSNPAP